MAEPWKWLNRGLVMIVARPPNAPTINRKQEPTSMADLVRPSVTVTYKCSD